MARTALYLQTLDALSLSDTIPMLTLFISVCLQPLWYSVFTARGAWSACGREGGRGGSQHALPLRRGGGGAGWRRLVGRGGRARDGGRAAGQVRAHGDGRVVRVLLFTLLQVLVDGRQHVERLRHLLLFPADTTRGSLGRCGRRATVVDHPNR